MPGWLHGVFVGEWLFVFPLCGFSLSLFCNYLMMAVPVYSILPCMRPSSGGTGTVDHHKDAQGDHHHDGLGGLSTLVVATL